MPIPTSMSSKLVAVISARIARAQPVPSSCLTRLTPLSVGAYFQSSPVGRMEPFLPYAYWLPKQAAIRQGACSVRVLGPARFSRRKGGWRKRSSFSGGLSVVCFLCGISRGSYLKPPTLVPAHDPLLRFEPIIQIVSILSPTLFIQRIGQRCDGHDILPRYGLSVQRCLRFLDVLFLRVRVCFECSLLHLSPLLLFIPSPTIV